MTQKWEYKATSPMLPPREMRANPDSPKMDSRDMEYWLNKMANHNWELVTYGEEHWHNEPLPQSWWIFRRLVVVQEGE